MTLTAQPAPDAIFVGRGGDCTGTGLCTVALTQNATVTAEFLGPRLLAVNLLSTENGGGSVQLVPSGLVCGVGPGFPPIPCNGSFKPGTPVQLTAVEAPDSVFVGWGGACAGTGTCIVPMTQHQFVTAEFLGPRLLAVNLVSTENGGGSVQIVPSGAVCGVGPGFPPIPVQRIVQARDAGPAHGRRGARLGLRGLGRSLRGHGHVHRPDDAAPGRDRGVPGPASARREPHEHRERRRQRADRALGRGLRRGAGLPAHPLQRIVQARDAGPAHGPRGARLGLRGLGRSLRGHGHVHRLDDASTRS